MEQAIMPANKTNSLSSIIERRLDVSHFREQHWEGTFWEYLDIDPAARKQ